MMSNKRRILVVEDQESERNALERVLRVAQYDVLTAKSAEDALDWSDQDVDLVISDLRMGKRSGIDLLMQWREVHKETPFILATAYGDVDSAVRAMKLGATDYLTKPIGYELEWVYSPDFEMVQLPCDPESAQRYLNLR